MAYEAPSAPDINQVEHNSGILKIYRMDEIWKGANSSFMNADYQKWNNRLERACIEMSALFSKDEIDEYNEINKKIDESFLYTPINFLKKKNPSLYSKIILLQRNLLLQKEKLLRKIEDKYGLGAKYKEDDSDFD